MAPISYSSINVGSGFPSGFHCLRSFSVFLLSLCAVWLSRLTELGLTEPARRSPPDPLLEDTTVLRHLTSAAAAASLVAARAAAADVAASVAAATAAPVPAAPVPAASLAVAADAADAAAVALHLMIWGRRG